MVRLPKPEDAGRLAEIHVFGWRHAYGGIVPDTELFVDRTVAFQTKFWNQLLAQNAGEVLVFDDGIVKGFCIHGPCRDEDASGAWEIQALYVEPAFLRQGVGTALLGPAEVAARERGCSRILIWALERNPLGPPFYVRRGYAPDGAVKTIDEWAGARELRFSKGVSFLQGVPDAQGF